MTNPERSKRNEWKKALHLMGGALALTGIVFVAVRLHAHTEELHFTERFGTVEVSLAFLLATLYAGSNILLARAWWHQLDFFDVQTSWRWALKVYGVSQLAKYVPGNIFHLAGRQALGMAAGLPARALAKSAAWELGSIAVIGGAFGALVLPLLWPVVSHAIALVVFGLILSGLYALVKRVFRRAVAVAMLWQAGFLALSGFIFVAVLALVAEISISWTLVCSVCGAYVVAWLVGLVTPGAPAGVGVRELVLLFLLQSLIDPEVLLITVVLGRVITVVGDLLFYFAAFFVSAPSFIESS